jgi:hypothetical protein
VYESHKIFGHRDSLATRFLAIETPSKLKAQAQFFEGMMCSSEGLFAPGTRPDEIRSALQLGSPSFFLLLKHTHTHTPAPLGPVQKVHTKNVGIFLKSAEPTHKMCMNRFKNL